jgi:3-hydroxybutyrate dehydrogenase
LPPRAATSCSTASATRTRSKRAAPRSPAEFDVEARYSPADLRQPGEIAAMIDTAFAQLGEVDILVNNAGVLHTTLVPVEQAPTRIWDDSIAVNLSAAFHTIKWVLPAMRAQNWGRIVNTSSTHGLIGAVDGAAYAASKHAVIGLTKTVALETAETGITCNAICPGLVDTPFVADHIAAAAERRGLSVRQMTEIALRTRQPSKKLVEIDEVAALVVHLCRDAAASITGAALVIDHGWTAM